MKIIFIYGAGNLGRAIAACFCSEKVKILGFIDNFKSEQVLVEDTYYPCMSTDEAILKVPDFIMIASREYEAEMIEDLLKKGYPEKNIVPFHMNLAELSTLMPLTTDKGWQYLNTIYCSNAFFRLNDALLGKFKTMFLQQKNNTDYFSAKCNLQEMKIRQIEARQEQMWRMQKELLENALTTNNEHTKKKIVLITLENDANVPERILSKCTAWLLYKILEERHKDAKSFEIVSMDMRVASIAILHNAAAIIFAGGGIIKPNHKFSMFSFLIDSIVEIADDYNIPVMFNSVGVEGYNINDARFAIMRKALNKKCVKVISVRDDIETLSDCYMQKNCDKKIRLAADAAVWAKEVYGISSDKNSQVVGVGVIRLDAYSEEKSILNENEVFRIYKELIECLEKRNMPYKFFTDGLPSDYQFLLQLQEKLPYVNWHEHMVDRPQSGEELINTIAGFRGVIAPRLHANILSYALDIPSIGMIWNKKVEYFGDMIGYPERFFYLDEKCTGWKMVDTLVKAMQSGNSVSHKKLYRDTTKEALNDFLNYINL